jgi:hypothetical protein
MESVGGVESKGVRRLATGSTVGLAAGIVGLFLPVTLILLATYFPGTIFLTGRQLIEVTAVLALGGAILFAVSLTLYRWGFWSLQTIDRRFWVASALCLLGMIGVVLVVFPMALAFVSSDAMASCIQGAPTKALTCLNSTAPLAGDLGLAGIWLLWIGGLGVVVGIGLASLRYREVWLTAGAVAYSLLLLGLIAPALALVFPVDGLVYPVLAIPLLILLAPALISHGSHRAMWSVGDA